MDTFDLSPYGIEFVLTPRSILNNLYTRDIRTADVESDAKGNIEVIEMGGVRYTVNQKLGSGTFGTTYKVVSSAGGKEYAIKQIKEVRTPYQINNMLKESIIQILLADASKQEENGPHVPYLYEVAYDIVKREAYIRSELMRNTFSNLLSGEAKDNDIIIPDALLQIANILDFFGKSLKFNHRDFKGDNIMYIRTDKDKRKYKLIDFGFSCITWNALQISGGGYFAIDRRCYIQHRDLSQLIYYICKYVNISKELLKELRSLLSANIHHKECLLLDKCSRIREWKNVYNILDRNNVNVPKGNPNAVRSAMIEFQNPRAKPVEPTKICPQGKVLNPKTGRCIKDTNKVAVAQAKKQAAPGECPPGKIMNPATKRCVNIDGPIGKKILAEQGVNPELAKPIEEALQSLAKPKPVSVKPEPPIVSLQPVMNPSIKEKELPFGSPKPSGRFAATRKFFRKLFGKKSKDQTRKY